MYINYLFVVHIYYVIVVDGSLISHLLMSFLKYVCVFIFNEGKLNRRGKKRKKTL